MSNDGFGTNDGSGTGFEASDGSDSIHIHIEDNEIRPTALPSIPNSMPNRSNPSSSLHSMLSRVRQHTIGNNIGHSSVEWRMNLNNLRTLISSRGNFRYTPLPASPPNDNLPDNEEHVHRHTVNRTSAETTRLSSLRRAHEHFNPERENFHDILLTSRNNEGGNSQNEVYNTQRNIFETRPSSRPSGANPQDIATAGVEAQVPLARLDEDNNNVFSDIFVRVLGNFVRYLPFLAILFVKFIHDHLLGILDIVLLQSVVYIVNKSLCNQVLKLSEKNVGVLLRDFGLITAAATFRFLLTASPPDPFGLILTPPTESMTVEISTTSQSPNSLIGEDLSTLKLLTKYLNSLNQKEPMHMDVGNTVTVTKAISLGLLIYYVAVNDLFVKMLTILTKIFVTMLPNKFLRPKQRAQMYALIEYFSQFYRALVPTRQWIMFLFKSYSGLEVISGILFSAFYMGAKGFEFASRGKVLHNALTTFIRNMDYERKPTKDELEAAGIICPICHDNYNTPIILTCNHIFCDDCVSQWFKREQTCPMCRAKVSEDPQWQDGTTTLFYQLC